MTHATIHPMDVHAAAKTVADAILPLLRSGDDLKWQIGDILTGWINSPAGESDVVHYLHNNPAAAFAAVSQLLADRGHDVTDGTLRSYYATAQAFPAEHRGANASWSTYKTVGLSGDVKGAPERMRTMLAAFAASGTPATKRNAQAFYGQPVSGVTGVQGVTDYITKHPEVVTIAIQGNPQVAQAARAGLESSQTPAEDDTTDDAPVAPLPRPTPTNPSLARIASMRRDLRALRSSVPYLRSEAERDEVLLGIQELIDGLQECVQRVDTRWQAA